MKSRYTFEYITDDVNRNWLRYFRLSFRYINQRISFTLRPQKKEKEDEATDSEWTTRVETLVRDWCFKERCR